MAEVIAVNLPYPPIKCLRFILFAFFIFPWPLRAAVVADDAKSLEGVWKPVSAELGGQAMPPAVVKAITLTIDKYTYMVTVEGEMPDKGTLSLNSKAKPKRMAITGTDGPNRGKTILSIYELKGDTIRICYDLSGQKYPAAFKSMKGTQLFLVNYRREKK